MRDMSSPASHTRSHDLLSLRGYLQAGAKLEICNFKQRNFKKYHHRGQEKLPKFNHLSKGVSRILALAAAHSFKFYLYKISSGYSSVQVLWVLVSKRFGKIQLF